MNVQNCFVGLLLGFLCGTLFSCQSTQNGSGTRAAGPEAALRKMLDDADESYNGRAYENALESYKAVYLAANSKNLDATATEAAAMVATTFATVGQSEEGDPWMERAEDKANDREPLAWTRVLLARGVRDWCASDEPKARGRFTLLYNYCFNNKLTPRAIQAAMLVSKVSKGHEQLEWMQRAIHAAQTTGNPKWEAPLWSEHAWLLDARKRHQEALEAFEKARDLTARAEVTRLGRLKTEWAYGHGLRMVGRLDEARDLLEQSNAKAHSIYIEKPSPRAAEFLGRVIAEIGEIDASEGRLDRARERFIAAREKMVEAGAIQGAPFVVRELEQRLKDLDKPPPTRTIPSKGQRPRG